MSQNFELLYFNQEIQSKVRGYRANIFKEGLACQPKQARDDYHCTLAFIEEILLHRFGGVKPL